MKLDLRDSRGGLPGSGDNPVGNFFRNASTQFVKKELVILLKPTIIQGDRNWEEDLVQTRARFEAVNTSTPASEAGRR